MQLIDKINRLLLMFVLAVCAGVCLIHLVNYLASPKTHWKITEQQPTKKHKR